MKGHRKLTWAEKSFYKSKPFPWDQLICVFYMTCVVCNVYWILYILKQIFFLHRNSQSPDVIAYLPVDYTTSQMSLCTGLAMYSQLKSSLPVSVHLYWVITGKCASVLGQKKLAGHLRVGVLQTVFWLSGKHTEDLRFCT